MNALHRIVALQIRRWLHLNERKRWRRFGRRGFRHSGILGQSTLPMAQPPVYFDANLLGELLLAKPAFPPARDALETNFSGCSSMAKWIFSRSTVALTRTLTISCVNRERCRCSCGEERNRSNQ